MKSSWFKTISIAFLCVLLGIGSYLFAQYFHPLGLEPWRVKKKYYRYSTPPLSAVLNM
jgi:hypothetical protein